MLMSPLYAALIGDKEIITITETMKQCLKDWRTIIQQILKRPISFLELIPAEPQFIGYTDSAKSAVGGAWICSMFPFYIIWRFKWPMEIVNQLITDKNPKGSITINDLELAGVLLHWLVLEHTSPLPLKNKHVGIYCDNMSTIAWTHKKCTTTSTIAGHLLRALALRQHINHTSPLQTVHIEGTANVMADVISRSFDDPKFTNTNKTFLQTFNSLFPLQNNSWKEFTLPKNITSKVISCLHGKQLKLELWTKITGQEKNIGNTGKISQKSSKFPTKYNLRNFLKIFLCFILYAIYSLT